MNEDMRMLMVAIDENTRQQARTAYALEASVRACFDAQEKFLPPCPACGCTLVQASSERCPACRTEVRKDA